MSGRAWAGIRKGNRYGNSKYSLISSGLGPTFGKYQKMSNEAFPLRGHISNSQSGSIHHRSNAPQQDAYLLEGQRKIRLI